MYLAKKTCWYQMNLDFCMNVESPPKSKDSVREQQSSFVNDTSAPVNSYR